MRCPLCQKDPIKTERGLRQHLIGTRKYGGHELSDQAAEDQIAIALGRGSARPVPEMAQAATRPLVAAAILGPSNGPAARPAGGSPLPPAEPVIQPASILPFLDSVLSTLVDFKALPKYQFERRIDAFLSVFLPEILARHLGGDVVLVAPEFPIKKPDNNQSTNVDYVLFRRGADRGGDRWLFFELKTDLGSVRDTQLDAYQYARQRGMAALRGDLQAIRSSTKEKAKYDALIDRFVRFPDAPIEIVVLAPGLVSHTAAHSITFRELLDMDLIGYATEWQTFRDLVIRQALA
jgi:hypothetical protein